MLRNCKSAEMLSMSAAIVLPADVRKVEEHGAEIRSDEPTLSIPVVDATHAVTMAQEVNPAQSIARYS